MPKTVTFSATRVFLYDNDRLVDTVQLYPFGGDSGLMVITCAGVFPNCVIYAVSDGFTSRFYRYYGRQSVSLLTIEIPIPRAIYYQSQPQLLLFATDSAVFYQVFVLNSLRRYECSRARWLFVEASRFIVCASDRLVTIIDTRSGAQYYLTLQSAFLHYEDGTVICEDCLYKIDFTRFQGAGQGESLAARMRFELGPAICDECYRKFGILIRNYNTFKPFAGDCRCLALNSVINQLVIVLERRANQFSVRNAIKYSAIPYAEQILFVHYNLIAFKMADSYLVFCSNQQLESQDNSENDQGHAPRNSVTRNGEKCGLIQPQRDKPGAYIRKSEVIKQQLFNLIMENQQYE